MSKMIFESPDGGVTVYRRTPGSPIRELVQIEMDLGNGWNAFMYNIDWDALVAEYPCLLEKLEELKVLEQLCKK